MSLRLQAEADLAVTLEDPAGFGWPVTVTDPSGTSADLIAGANDIATSIDQETGQIVSGRTAEVHLRISTLASKGLGIPRGVADKTEKPWLVSFADIGAHVWKFKVSDARPDRTIGIVICVLEAFKP